MTSSKHPPVNYADLLGKGATLAAAFLPAVGVIARWITYTQYPEIAPALAVATGASLPTLAVTGFMAVSPQLLITSIFLFRLPRYKESSPERRTKTSPFFFLLFLIVGLAALAILPGWPRFVPAFSLSAIFGAWSSSLIYRIKTKNKVPSFATVLPPVLLFVAGGSVAAGFAQLIPDHPAGQYDFSGDLAPLNGIYVEIGEDKNRLYLLSCSDHPKLISVQPASQVSVSVHYLKFLKPALDPSLWHQIRDDFPPTKRPMLRPLSRPK